MHMQIALGDARFLKKPLKISSMLPCLCSVPPFVSPLTCRDNRNLLCFFWRPEASLKTSLILHCNKKYYDALFSSRERNGDVCRLETDSGDTVYGENKCSSCAGVLQQQICCSYLTFEGIAVTYIYIFISAVFPLNFVSTECAEM